MRVKKNVVQGSSDRRRNSPIDEVRAKFWHSAVKLRSGCSTNYALATIFGDDKKKWENYERGGQPNEITLNIVEEKWPNTKSLFTEGPQESKLWLSLIIEDLKLLRLIKNNSSQIDGLIADFRLRILNNEFTGKDIELFVINGHFNGDTEYINYILNEILRKDLADSCNQYLINWCYHTCTQAIVKFYEELLQELVPSGVTSKEISEMDEMLEKDKYLLMSLPTIKNKGKRKII